MTILFIYLFFGGKEICSAISNESRNSFTRKCIFCKDNFVLRTLFRVFITKWSRYPPTGNDLCYEIPLELKGA